jgi:gluconokinase
LRKTEKGVKARIAGVGISCFWHSLVGVGENGRAVTPLYSWADTRSQEYAVELAKKLDPGEYHRRTGCFLHSSYWPAKLTWLAETAAGEFQRATHWMSFGEYVALRLFGKAICSVSTASGTGLFDPNLLRWDKSTLEALPLSTDQLNPISEHNGYQQGLAQEWAPALAAVRDVPWFPALGDGACSNVGSGAWSENRIAVNVGTSGAMRIVVGGERADIKPGLFCYRADETRFVIGGALTGGGNIYAWLHDTLKLDSRQTAARKLSVMPPDSHGLTVLPFWAGERSPGWRLGARATITGLNLHTTALDILRASLEAVAYTFADILDRLRASYPNASEIIASGGAVLHSPAWVQIMADVFGCTVSISDVPEASSRGAALFALERLGLIESLSSAPLYTGRVYRPSPERGPAYGRARARYADLYRTLLGTDVI